MTKSATPPTSLSAFGNRDQQPNAESLRRMLGRSSAAWEALVRHVSTTYPPANEQWKYAGARYGWSLRLRQRERVVLYLIPQRGHFLVGIVLGAKAVALAKEAGLPDDVLDEIARARPYAEGTGIRLPVRQRADVPVIETLAALKLGKG